MKNNLYARMQYEKVILLVGDNYKCLSNKVLNYDWNMVATTTPDSNFSIRLDNDSRIIREIESKNDMQDNLLNKKNLHLIRLLGGKEITDSLTELEIDDISSNVLDLLTRIVSVIKETGIILIENSNDTILTSKLIRNVFKSLYENQSQVYIFNYTNSDDIYIDDLIKKGIITVYKESLNSFFDEYFLDYDEENNDDEESDKKSVKLYINAEKTNQVTSISKRELLEIENFAILLNINLLKTVKIPKMFYSKYFELFLKNSAKEPQWYGYEYGFNITRSYEEELYQKTQSHLSNVGKVDNKQLLLEGQTGTGKSIALAALAVKIFNERKYPVIFINNPEINFYLEIEYKHKNLTKKWSQSFNALDRLIKSLENNGAKAVLIIWDTSSYNSGAEKCYRLYQALLARGRKIFMVSTSYENCNNITNTGESDDENNAAQETLIEKFDKCKAKIEITNELIQLRDILEQKCGMEKNEFDNIIKIYKKEKKNFLYLFYQVFRFLRKDLSNGVYKEANLSLDELEKFISTDFRIHNESNNVFRIAFKEVEDKLIKAGIINLGKEIPSEEKEKIRISKENFVKCVAVCSKFKLKMPYDFALRLLKVYDQEIIKELSKTSFFVIDDDEYGNYEISIRTPLEADMFLQAKEMSAMEQIDCIKIMLSEMKTGGEYGQCREAKLCESLIRIIGPNNRSNKYTYNSGYKEIIGQLENLRIERNIWVPILVSQEITYIREVYGRNKRTEKDKRIEWLKKAIEIADELLEKIEKEGTTIGTRNALVVEAANSKLLLCELQETTDDFYYRELKRNLLEVIKYDSQDFHAYVTFLKACRTEYANEQDDLKKIKLLEAMCLRIDEILLENTDIADSEYFQTQVTNIYAYLKNENIVENYIDELADNGSASGIYVVARKRLNDGKIDFKHELKGDSKYEICENVYDLLTNKKYKQVVVESEACQYTLLNIVWLLNNKKPMYEDGECWKTNMEEEVWRKLLNICNNYFLHFGMKQSNVYKFDRNFKYIQALCFAQLKQYDACVSALKEIEEDSSMGMKRIYVKHLICDNGITRKFNGKIINYNETDRSGKIAIEEFRRTPLYFFGPNLYTSNFKKGTIIKNLEIGLSFISPKVIKSERV